jgi:hypothetical protein
MRPFDRARCSQSLKVRCETRLRETVVVTRMSSSALVENAAIDFEIGSTPGRTALRMASSQYVNGRARETG